MPTSTMAGHVRGMRSCCLSDSCTDGRCALILPRALGEIACIEGSRYQRHHGVTSKLCDCIIFWSFDGRDILAPAELKSGQVKAIHCLAQLQNGAKVAQSLLDAAYQSIRFEPLIVHRGRIHYIEYKILGNRRVTFRKIRRVARLVKSGTHLTSVVP